MLPELSILYRSSLTSTDLVGSDALYLVIAAACLVVAVRSARRAVVPIGALARALASAALTAFVLCVALALIAIAALSGS
jgi:hypothetical protein